MIQMYPNGRDSSCEKERQHNDYNGLESAVQTLYTPEFITTDLVNTLVQ